MKFGRANHGFDEFRHVVAVVLLIDDALDQLVIVAHREALVDLQSQGWIVVAAAAGVGLVWMMDDFERRCGRRG